MIVYGLLAFVVALNLVVLTAIVVSSNRRQRWLRERRRASLESHRNSSGFGVVPAGRAETERTRRHA